MAEGLVLERRHPAPHLSLDPCFQYVNKEALQHIWALTAVQTQHWFRQCKTLFVIGAPRSASTFLAQLLASTFGYEQRAYCDVTQRPDGTEATLDTSISMLRVISLKATFGHTVGHHHALGTPHNFEAIRILNMCPILTRRNLFDAVVSYRDRLVARAASSTQLSSRPTTREYVGAVGGFRATVPWAVLDNLSRRSYTRQIDYVIEEVLPFYCEFYASWYLCMARGLPLHVVDYGALTQTPVDCIRGINARYHLDPALTDEHTASAVDDLLRDRRRANLNVGQSGRGADLTPRQKKRVCIIGSRYLRDNDLELLLA
jgi:hypothetical protein